MLQSIRNKASSWFVLAILFMALFALTFFGIGDYFTTRVDTHVATVGDSKIEQSDYQQRYQNWRANMSQSMGDNLDPAMLDQPIWRERILDEMITETVLKNANERLGVVVAPSQLQSIIRNEPTFQLAGQFDPETYRAWLSRQRMTPAMLEQRLRDQIGAQLLPAGVAASSTVTDAELDAYLRLSEQTRDARFLRVTSTSEEVSQDISDEELQAYYDEHSAQFMSDETVTVEYVEIDAKSIDVDIEPSESELQERFAQEKVRFSTPEQRHAAQILVRPEGDTDEARAAALAKANSLVEQARAEDADFAALARENSDDLGSRAQGGDLGWLEQGLTDPAFDEALFALEVGAVSDPVRTEDGYHIITLRELRAGTEKTFEEVRDQLRDESLQRERERVFSEKAGRLADTLYADPDAMVTAAADEGLQVKTAGPFGRNASQGIFATPAVRRAAFSDRVLTEGDVSEAINIGPNHVLLLRVVEHKPSEARPLAEVTDTIRSRILAQRRNDAVKAHAESLLAALESGQSLEELATSLGEDAEVERAEGITRVSATPEQALVAQIFRLPRPAPDAGGPVRRLLEIGGGYAITELTAVRDGDPAKVEAGRRDQAREQLQQSRANAEQAAFVAALRRGERIEISNSQQNPLEQ